MIDSKGYQCGGCFSPKTEDDYKEEE